MTTLIVSNCYHSHVCGQHHELSFYSGKYVSQVNGETLKVRGTSYSLDLSEINPHWQLSVSDTTHFLTSDNITLTQKVVLIVSNAFNGLNSDNIDLTFYEKFTSDSYISVTSDNIQLISILPEIVREPLARAISCNRAVVNNLEEIKMIAGTEREFTYYVCTEDGELINLNSGSNVCSISIFKYGEPETEILTMPGIVSACPAMGEFIVNFTGDLSSELCGVYEQQVKIIDLDGTIHIPSRGKIIIFPNTQYYIDKFS